MPPHSLRSLRIGTRGSLMALAQTRRVAAQLTALYPGLEITLVPIRSEGDQDQTTPLWQMAPGIFTRALDSALLDGSVDCVVHSFKDLGTERPAGLALAALTARDAPHDIVLFRADIAERLRTGAEIRIGSSAPRRAHQVPRFLSQALPHLAGRPCVTLHDLRGNAHSRIQKLHGPRIADAPGTVDGVVLALGGLARLWGDAEGRPVIERLLRGLPRMILPRSHCPSAPGQGVVAIETRADAPDVLALFAPLHDAPTARAVAAERAVLVQHGGGCHQRFGVNLITHMHFPEGLLRIRGTDKAGARLDQDLWAGAPPAPGGPIFDAMDWRRALQESCDVVAPLPSAGAYFAAHARAVPTGAALCAPLWTSGASSWFMLARRGQWVEGCAEGLGFDAVCPLLATPLLQLPALADWCALTHEDARAEWTQMPSHATYRLRAKDVLAPDAAALRAALAGARVAWWGSRLPFDALRPLTAHVELHACGPGRTADYLTQMLGRPPVIFPDRAAFRRWAGLESDTEEAA